MSEAAELVVERKEELCRRAEGWRVRVERAIRSHLALAGARVSGEKRAEGLLRFRYRLRERRERVAQDLGALKSALERRPARLAARLESARRALAAFPRMAELSRKADAVANRRRQLEDRMGFSLARRTGQLRDCGEKLGLVNPFAILARGYAVAYREGTKSPLLSAESVRPGERIRVRLHEGELRAIVRGVPVPRPARTPDGDFGPLFSDATEDNP